MNDPYTNRPLNQVPWINARDMNKPSAKIAPPPKIDPEASKILGQEVRVNDPRLIKAVVQLKRERQQKGGDKSDAPDGFYADRKFKEVLKENFK